MRPPPPTVSCGYRVSSSRSRAARSSLNNVRRLTFNMLAMSSASAVNALRAAYGLADHALPRVTQVISVRRRYSGTYRGGDC